MYSAQSVTRTSQRRTAHERARSLRPRRKKRKGEYVCDCKAYGFPHRFGGGACTGRSIVAKQWKASKGWAGPCLKCHCRDREAGLCQALEGQEALNECPALEAFIQQHEIRMYRRR